MRKITLLMVALLGIMTISAQSGSTTMYLYTQGSAYSIGVTCTSENSQYYVGTFDGSSMLYNYQTGEVYVNVGEQESNYTLFNGVTNSGVVVGGKGTSLNDMRPCTYANSTFTNLPLISGSVANFGAAQGTSSDGGVIVGYLFNDARGFHPVVWLNNAASMLPYPATDVFGDATDGAVADKVSADGSIIIGRLYNSRSHENGLIWRYNAATSSYEYEYFGLGVQYDFNYPTTSNDFDTQHYLDFSTMELSPNGRYLITTDVDRNFFIGSGAPIVFDFVLNDSTIYSGLTSALGMGVSNNGLVTVAAPPMAQPYRSTYVYTPGNSSVPVAIEDYLAVEYSFNNWPTDILPESGTIKVSGDGEHFYGYGRNDEFYGVINTYIAPTAAVSTPEITKGNDLVILNTLISDNTLRIEGDVKMVRIIDTTGRVIMVSENNNNINISSLGAGLYLVELTDTKNAVATSRIVKK